MYILNFFLHDFLKIFQMRRLFPMLLAVGAAENTHNSETTVSTVLGFVKDVLAMVFSFIRAILGDNTPGQPALAAAMPDPLSNNFMLKASCLSVLSVIAFAVCMFVKKFEPKNTQPDLDYSKYRNMDLTENFL